MVDVRARVFVFLSKSAPVTIDLVSILPIFFALKLPAFLGNEYISVIFFNLFFVKIIRFLSMEISASASYCDER